MEHARKMVLIPSDRVEQIQKQQQIPTTQSLQQDVSNFTFPTTQTPGNTINRLDSEMSQILYSPYCKDEREKWKMYQQVLQRFLFFTGDKRKPLLTEAEIEKNSEEKVQVGDTVDETILPVEDIVDSVPKSYKAKSELLLQQLQKPNIKSRFKWDRGGNVFIDGFRLEGSTIVDLINDAVRHRKTVYLPGRRQFAAFLRDISVPREFVGNESYFNHSQTNVTLPTAKSTPVSVRKSKRSKRSEKTKIRPYESLHSENSEWTTDDESAKTKSRKSNSSYWLPLNL